MFGWLWPVLAEAAVGGTCTVQYDGGSTRWHNVPHVILVDVPMGVVSANCGSAKDHVHIVV